MPTGSPSIPGSGTPAAPKTLQIAGLPEPIPANGVYLDDNYTAAFPTGLPVPEFPFLCDGDMVTVAFRQPYEQAAVSYTLPDPTKTLTNVAGAYLTGDRDFRDAGGGILAFTRCASRVPLQRVVKGQSYRYSFRYFTVTTTSGGDDGGSFSEDATWYTLLKTVDCQMVYDYFLVGQEANFPLLDAPEFVIDGPLVLRQGSSIYPNAPFPLYVVGTTVCSHDALILAESDTYGTYAGAIRYRQRRLIVGPTPAFWGTAVS